MKPHRAFRASAAGALLLCLCTPPASSSSGSTDDPSSRAARAAAEIDRRVAEDLSRRGVTAGPVVDDSTFLRRAYLAIVGRIPTIEEADPFLASRDPARRRRLVDDLLRRPGHTSHTYNYWADLLRVKTKLTNNVSGEPYRHWLKSSIDTHKPYDQFVRELLTAEGAAHARDNGATGYYMRDRGMPEDNMANTVRLFLGTRLECAQCHDHPFDKWTQRQFFEMAAFTGGMKFKTTDLMDGPAGDSLKALKKEYKQREGQVATKAFNRMLRSVVAGIGGNGSAWARLPDDYQYDDAKPKEWIAAHSMFGPEVSLPLEDEADTGKAKKNKRKKKKKKKKTSHSKEVDSRAAYADWLTSPENPLFTRVISNRMWKRVMGYGLVEPIDDIKDDSVPSNPELMAHLEGLMIELDYDLTQFERVLCYTDTFQRSSRAPKPPAAGPRMRRMSAEQVWDSLLTLARPDPDGDLANAAAAAEKVYLEYESFAEGTDEELRARLDREVLRYRDRKAYNELRKQEKAAARQQKKEIRQLEQKLARARKKKQLMREAELLAELEQLGVDPDRPNNRRDPNLLRASELKSPAEPGHLLEKFGQSDRDQIEASHRDPNVPQVLALLNGFLEDHVLQSDDSPLMRSVADAATSEQKVRVAFLGVLTREPDRDELGQWRADVARDGDPAVRDLVWTLVNSHEFRFIR